MTRDEKIKIIESVRECSFHYLAGAQAAISNGDNDLADQLLQNAANYATIGNFFLADL